VRLPKNQNLDINQQDGGAPVEDNISVCSGRVSATHKTTRWTGSGTLPGERTANTCAGGRCFIRRPSSRVKRARRLSSSKSASAEGARSSSPSVTSLAATTSSSTSSSSVLVAAVDSSASRFLLPIMMLVCVSPMLVCVSPMLVCVSPMRCGWVEEGVQAVEVRALKKNAVKCVMSLVLWL
jgi:hypothetical protein